MRPRLAIVTSRFPFGSKEAFFHDEIGELSEHFDIALFATLPDNSPSVLTNTSSLQAPRIKMFSPDVAQKAAREIARNPAKVARLFYDVTTAPQRATIRFRNAAVFPKALAIAHEVRRRNIEHVHAYWLSTPATVAYVAASLNEIPWSATGHRYDLVNYNITSVGKPNAGFLRDAQFVRAISERGRNQILSAIGRDKSSTVPVIHLGVRLPRYPAQPVTRKGIHLICVAAFERVKGHVTLFQALQSARMAGIPLHCTLAGDGPERLKLEKLARTMHIEETVTFAGNIPHEVLMTRLHHGEYDAVILTSIDEGWDQCEGIPVCLMEAMAARIPCIATNSGSVGELVNNANGFLLDTNDYQGIAHAILTLARSFELRTRLGEAGRAQIGQEFDVQETARTFGCWLGNRPKSPVSGLVTLGKDLCTISF